MKRPEEQAFLAAYDAHADALFRYCYFRSFDRERAKDLVQESFLKTWEYLAAGNEIRDLKPFLYRVAHNLSVNEAVRRKALSLDEMREVAGFDPIETRLPSPEEEAEYAQILAALGTLEPAERDAVVLRHIEGVPVAEIAGMTGEEPNTVSVRIHRALKKLRQTLHLP